MKKMLLIGLVAMMTGCVTPLPPAQPQAPARSSLAQLQLGDAGGYTPTVTVEVPATVCDRPAFDDGVRAGYITSWNQLVSGRTTMHQLLLQRKPKDGRYQANVQLYKGKIIVSASLPQDSQFLAQGQRDVDNCRVRGFGAGKLAGTNAALAEYQALIRLEA